MKDLFNLKTFLIENKLTESSRLIKEAAAQVVDATLTPTGKFRELINLFDKKTRYTVGDERRVLEDGQVLLVVQNHPFPDSRLVQTERGIYFFDKGHGVTYFTSQVDMGEELVDQITQFLSLGEPEISDEPIPYETEEDYYDRKWRETTGIEDMEESFESPEADAQPEDLVLVIKKYYDLDSLAERVADMVFNGDPGENLMNFVEELLESPNPTNL